ncbi:DNA replication complex GINS protein Psf3p [Diutina catenulata]
MYYDLDDILAVQQKVPCRFNCTVPGLGYLEGNPGRALEANTKVDLPFWLASVLNTISAQDDASQDDYTFLDIEDPEFINTKVLNAIRASATTIDLHKIAQHYYNLVIRWCTMYSQDDLVKTVMEMLRQRAVEINNFASNANKSVHNEFLYSLDEWEKKLYKITSESNKDMREWLRE